MERTYIIDAKKLFRSCFFGPDEIKDFFLKFHLEPLVDNHIDIPFSLSELDKLKDDYLLILGFKEFKNHSKFNILTLRNLFGIDPQKFEPCFYNQDWYLNETFVSDTLEPKWYLIQKEVIQSSRSMDPKNIVSELGINLPSALICAFAFFLNYSINNSKLWEFDFVWCSDLDHNGDRIYVGKYSDVSGINKNGFSIHRHLSLRDFYGAINEVN